MCVLFNFYFIFKCEWNLWTVVYLTVYSPSLSLSSFSFSSVVTAFLNLFLSRAFHYDSLGFFCSYYSICIPLLLLFKVSPFISASLARIIFSQLIRPCTDFAISFLFRFSRVSSLSLSRSILSLPPPRSSVCPFSISVCLRVL